MIKRHKIKPLATRQCGGIAAPRRTWESHLCEVYPMNAKTLLTLSLVIIFLLAPAQVIPTAAQTPYTTRAEPQVAGPAQPDQQAAGAPNSAQPYDLLAALRASDVQPDDLFGQSVAQDGYIIAVGAPNHDSGALADSGTVYVFHDQHLNAFGAWAILQATDAQAGDRFGTSVAVSSTVVVSGALVVVGAPHAASNSDNLNTGAVYIFTYDAASYSWNQIARLTASDAQFGDRFGYAVALDGDTLVIGARDADGSLDNPVTDTGAVYIFERNPSGQWDETARLIADNSGSYDGWYLDDVKAQSCMPSATLGPDSSLEASPATVVTHTFVLANETLTDTFALSIEGNLWPTTLVGAAQVTVTQGASVTLAVQVDAPLAAIGESDAFTLTAASANIPGLALTTHGETTIVAAPAVTLLPDTQAITSTAGAAVTYTPALTNHGDFTDTFTVTASGVWTATLSQTNSGPLAPGESLTVTLTVDIPAAAAPGAFDETTVTATSTLDDSVTAVATARTAAWAWFRIFLPLAQK
jgi:hypothetical protein